MSFLGGKRYRKCHQAEDGSVECLIYKPSRDGKKIVTGTAKATLTPNCEVAISEIDGDIGDVEELEEYLSKRARAKCKAPTEA